MKINNSLTLLTITAFSQISAHEIETTNRSLNFCPSGGIADLTNTYCCLESCVTCGGFGCDTREGGEAGCCTSKISDPCSSGAAPCVNDEIIFLADEILCPSGSIFDSTGQKCCDAKCGKCGGNGCHLREGGEEACCVGSVTTLCSNGTLPCVADSSYYGTETPIEEGPVTCNPNPCQNGASCVYAIHLNVRLCICKDGWTGVFCEVLDS
mmetsp:Transcript_11851/g.17670  ORF Transcript_11851/g.17670 Transcript_11851/m.17670 type:complete len:210 (+) Transcript_11851:46-675(+)